ncbi:MAG: hypothetical protein J6I60_02645 [Bacteroidaceae bacterium]|nr:hypothetical protein [Bacteroidaceae bacterium]
MKDIVQSVQKKLYQRPSVELIYVEVRSNLMAVSGGGGDAGGGGGSDVEEGRAGDFEDEELDFESKMVKLPDLLPFVRRYNEKREGGEG